MAQTIHVEGVGDVDFPDNFSDKQITHAIETDILPNAHKTASPVETTGGGAATGVFPQMTGRRALQDTERSSNIPMAVGESALAGAASIPAALAEYIGYRKPAQMVQEAKQHAADISYPAVSSLGSMIGEGATVGPVAGKAFQLAGKIPALGGSTLFKSGAGGLTAGALTPTEGKGEFSEEKPMQLASSTAMGAGLGKVGQMLMNPHVSDDVKRLIDLGMTKFTPGQLMSQTPIMGDFLREAEKKATSVPLLGDIIGGGLRTSFKDFNKVMANKALEPLGITVPSNVKEGSETNQFINQAISDAYEYVRNNSIFRTNFIDTHGRDVAQRLEDQMNYHAPNVTSDKKQFTKDIKNDIIDLIRSSKILGGDTFREMEEKLGQLTTEGYAKNSTLGKSYENMLHSLRNELALQNPSMASFLKNTHEVFKNQKVIEDASSRRGNADALYSPQQFGSAVQAKAGKGQTSQGMGRFVDEANSATNVLGNTVPDSGTAGRSMIGAALLGGGSMLPLVGPLAIKGLMASGAYSPVGMKMLTNLATKRPEVFQKASPYVSGGLSALGGVQGAQPDIEPQTNP
jgi:hypothetical protein